MRDGRWGLRVGVPVALALLCALPAGAEAEYRSVGQWQVPTEATSIAVGPSGVFVSNDSSSSTEAQVAGYSPEGQLRARWGGFENGRARGLSVGSDGRVWVVDYSGRCGSSPRTAGRSTGERCPTVAATGSRSGSTISRRRHRRPLHDGL